MSIQEKQELWYNLITAAFANGNTLSAEEQQFFKAKAAKMSEEELDKDIADLQAATDELSREV